MVCTAVGHGQRAGRRGRGRWAADTLRHRRSTPDQAHRAIAEALKAAEQGTVLLGQRRRCSIRRRLGAARAGRSGSPPQAGATLGYLGEAGNNVGAWMAGAVPHRAGGAAAPAIGRAPRMLRQPLEGATAARRRAGAATSPTPAAHAAMRGRGMVVALSPFTRRPGCSSTPTCCCRSRRSPRPPAPSSTPRAGAELPRRRRAAGRDAPGLEGAARAGQPAGCRRFRLRGIRPKCATRCWQHCADLTPDNRLCRRARRQTAAQRWRQLGANRRRTDLLRSTRWSVVRTRCS